MNLILVLIGKLLSLLIQIFKLGNGSTWPGHIALNVNPKFVKDLFKKSNIKVIFIIGTNGKTTTSKLISTILEENGYSVLHNTSGANLLNGVASSLIIQSDIFGKLNNDFAILEVDENVFSKISDDIEPDFLICLNLFRDQLDRYGEIDSISKKWKKTVDNFVKTEMILNADDPQIAYLGNKSKLKTYYFGLNKDVAKTKLPEHGTDSTYCPNCGNKLSFDHYYFSHLGVWECKNCKFKRPKLSLSEFSYYPLSGKYAIYNTLASVLFSKRVGIKSDKIEKALKEFKPAFGRQENIKYKNTNIQIFLSKNPTSFNESLSTVSDLNGKTIIMILNDKIPDGLDVSWIWDINLETILKKEMNIIVAGDRKYDLALRLKYSGHFIHIADNIKEALEKSIQNLEANEKLYILPNYSAMLEVRKILTGKEIL